MNREQTILAALAREGCLGRSAADEPVFVLVARDKFAAQTVRDWADAVEAATEPDSPSRDKVASARELAHEMEVWRLAHGGKVPD